VNQRRFNPARFAVACVALGALLALVFFTCHGERLCAWLTDWIDVRIDRVGRWLNHEPKRK
jgi:hypothetical protein